MNMSKVFAAAAAAIITAVLATAATAQPVRTAVSVSYADLNLGSVSGQTTLAKRINTAAAAACDVDANVRDHAIKASSDRCFNAAVSRANLAIASADTLVVASR